MSVCVVCGLKTFNTFAITCIRQWTNVKPQTKQKQNNLISILNKQNVTVASGGRLLDLKQSINYQSIVAVGQG